MQASDIPVVILAGGAGRRMGGKCKCLLEVDGKSLLDHILIRLKTSQKVILNTNDDANLFESYSLPVVKDAQPLDIGPLGGLYSAWQYLKSKGEPSEYLLSVAGDTPFLPKNLLEELLVNLDSGVEVRFCQSNEREHYVLALWSRSALDKLDTFIRDGGRSVGQFIRSLNHDKKIFENFDQDPFFNINTPEQLDQAQARLRN